MTKIDIVDMMMVLKIADHFNLFSPLDAEMRRLVEVSMHGPYSPFYWNRRNHDDFWGSPTVYITVLSEPASSWKHYPYMWAEIQYRIQNE